MDYFPGKPIFEFFCPGDPIRQPRHRHRIAGKAPKQFVSLYIPGDDPVHAWKNIVCMSFRVAAQKADFTIIDTAVAVDLAFCMRRNKTNTNPNKINHVYWHDSKPDVDNLTKSVLDSLSGHAWTDDAKICSGLRDVVVAGDDGIVGVAVRLREPDTECRTWADHLIRDKSQNLF